MTSLLVKPRNKKELSTFKKVLKLLDADFETKEKPYNPDFVAKILRGVEDSKNGKCVTITLEDLWK
jgi:hypothetical protein